jgi:hypothetical protein
MKSLSCAADQSIGITEQPLALPPAKFHDPSCHLDHCYWLVID